MLLLPDLIVSTVILPAAVGVEMFSSPVKLLSFNMTKYTVVLLNDTICALAPDEAPVKICPISSVPMRLLYPKLGISGSASSADSYIALILNTSAHPRDICLSSSLCPYPAVVCVRPFADDPDV